MPTIVIKIDLKLNFNNLFFLNMWIMYIIVAPKKIEETINSIPTFNVNLEPKYYV